MAVMTNGPLLCFVGITQTVHQTDVISRTALGRDPYARRRSRFIEGGVGGAGSRGLALSRLSLHFVTSSRIIFHVDTHNNVGIL